MTINEEELKYFFPAETTGMTSSQIKFLCHEANSSNNFDINKSVDKMDELENEMDKNK